ncbi:MAG: hypothetical protein DRQ45_00650 [Gammaproteobacteria bacterium]|nr:MAG: hypothetical protein DRQ45_00650 [Gammaproteobacteria bacterium]
MNSEIFLNIEYRNLYILPLGLTVDVLSWLQKNPDYGVQPVSETGYKHRNARILHAKWRTSIALTLPDGNKKARSGKSGSGP